MSVVTLATKEPNQRVVDALTRALEQAKNGDLQAVAIVAVSNSHHTILEAVSDPPLTAALLGMATALTVILAQRIARDGVYT